MRPGKVSPKLAVPENIVKPDYGLTSYPASEISSKFQTTIEVKTPEDIEILRKVCLLGR